MNHLELDGKLTEAEICRSKILSEGSWPETPEDITDEWSTVIFVCDNPYNYDGLVRIAESYYGNRDFQLNCGLTGLLTLSLSASETVSSSVSVSAGLKIDQAFNFGIQWGQTATATNSTTVAFEMTSELNHNDRTYVRLKKYRVDYNLGMAPFVYIPDCAYQVNDAENETVFTLSMQTRLQSKSCCTNNE